MSNQKPVYILSAKRTPLGAFLGNLSQVSGPKLGAHAIASAVKAGLIKPDHIEQVYMGCVLSAGVGQAPARQAALFAELPNSVACTTINKVCGSGMKAVMLGAQSIETGEAEVVIGGGMENMSQVPHYFVNSRSGLRMGNGTLVDGMVKDGLWDVYNNFHMGSAAEMCVKKMEFTRETQDEFAKESFRKAQKAIEAGFFKDEIAVVEVPQKKGDALQIDTDEGPGKAQFDKMGKLSPVFEKSGTITAANASTINDGAAALVLAGEDYVKKTGVKPLAKIVGYTQHAQEPAWFSTAPVGAMEKLLKKTSWSIKDIDLFEINEAFAAVTMAAIKELNLDPAKVNVNGGAVSLGHPIGASGARILVTLVHAMKRLQKKRGMASICIGGGEACAMAIELV